MTFYSDYVFDSHSVKEDEAEAAREELLSLPRVQSGARAWFKTLEQ